MWRRCAVAGLVLVLSACSSGSVSCSPCQGPYGSVVDDEHVLSEGRYVVDVCAEGSCSRTRQDVDAQEYRASIYLGQHAPRRAGVVVTFTYRRSEVGPVVASGSGPTELVPKGAGPCACGGYVKVMATLHAGATPGPAASPAGP
jgi:hypothetical protein